uniref:F-box domain-containing protein n=1 Tax=Oryza rufipogon TaxID=4529 RepID=A0A0E0QHG3_ORYRU
MAKGTASPSRDRISELPDDLLIRILSFAPVKQAASTTLLSRRWHLQPLWLETGTVNIDLTSEEFRHWTCPWWCGWGREGDARAALRRRRHGLKKLTVTRPADRDDGYLRSDCRDFSWYLKPIVFDGTCVGLLRHVDELRLECQVAGGSSSSSAAASSPQYKYKYAADPGVEYYLSMDKLPCEDFRVLDITGCCLQEVTTAEWLWEWDWIGYPCLTTLRLRRCTVRLCDLQNSPSPIDHRSAGGFIFDFIFDEHIHLHCPAVTSFTMVNCHIDGRTFELDAPSLICFRCAQVPSLYFSISLKSAAPCLAQVDLESISGTATFGPLLNTMCHISILKLTVYSIVGDIKFGHLPLFPNLKRLVIEELCGFAMDGGLSAAATVVGDMLRRCPAIRELWIRFSWLEYLNESADDHLDADLTAYLKSSICRLQESDYCNHCKESDTPAAGSTQNFNGSWQSSLRKVVIQFQKGKLTCSQVQLVKFLAENASVLEEFEIEGGNHHGSDHIIKSKVGRWGAASSMENEAPPGVGAGDISG